MRTLFRHAPPEYSDALGSIDDCRDAGDEQADFIHAFYTDCEKLAADVTDMERNLAPGGILWVSWPKESSGVASDIGEEDLRNLLLPTGLVDVKVAAITDVWSGPKFLRRRTAI